MMDVNVLNETARPLLGRKDVRVRLFHGGATPTRSTIVGALAGALNAKKDVIMVRTVRAEFGNAASVIEASVYESKAALEQFEAAHIRKRHGGEEKPTEETSAAQGPASEEGA